MTAPARPWDLRLGRWQDVLADVEMVDAVITDPPYSKRTHDAHKRQGPRTDGNAYQVIPYESWTDADTVAFVDSWAPRCRGWFVALTSHDLVPVYAAALEARGRYVFQPVPCVMRGMNVRLGGDGPSSWAVYAVVARPRDLVFSNWGTLPGAYFCPPGSEMVGGKPEALMRALIRDYTKPGDLVCDPCAGAATTLRAAEVEGRCSIGAEMDPETYAKARKRLEAGYTPTFDFGEEMAR